MSLPYLIYSKVYYLGKHYVAFIILNTCIDSKSVYTYECVHYNNDTVASSYKSDPNTVQDFSIYTKKAASVLQCHIR